MSTTIESPVTRAQQNADQSNMDRLSINTIRTLAMDAVQAANSGHPGTPMAMAPVAYTLWQEFLRFDPQDPVWPNRDRFVLSIGHASMLLYSLLHLTEVRAVSKDYETLGEVSVPLDAIKAFRQLDSRCPGHPEYGAARPRGRHQRRHGHRPGVAGRTLQQRSPGFRKSV
jgi:transketolase